MTPYMTGFEVFGQTSYPSSPVYILFRTCKTQRRANLWVWFYSKIGFVLPNYGNARLFFDSAPIGEGWV